MAGPIPYPESAYPESLPQQPYPGQVPSAYPGAMPPPVNYPKSPRKRRIVLFGAGLVVAALVAAAVVGIIASRSGEDDAAVAVTDGSATTAIQGYLNALTEGDDETIARNNACGFFDAVKDRRSDMALADLSGDAFRRQFGSATVASIDKIVTWSPNQSQVLFTMRATPAGRSQAEVERQGVAQLLIQDDGILVCSYLPRSTGQF